MNADPLEHRTTPRSAAAYWLNHRRSGDMTAQEARAFQVWLDRDPANRTAYQELERLWGVLVAAVDDPEVIAARERDARRFDVRVRLRWAAIAAGVLVLVGGGLIGSRMLGNGFGPAPSHPELLAQADLRTQVGQGITEFRTSVGQRTTVTLPDRSVVTLDTDTVLRMHHTAGERRVSLEQGRAFFRVAKDPTRPFIVVAGDHLVRAIGTAFDVRVDPDHFEVTLVEGRVKVETPTARRKKEKVADLRPGQRFAAVDESAPRLLKVDLRTETSWHLGRLTFVRDPIAEAVEEMNRYSEKKIVFRGGAAPERSIIGVFRAGDVDSFAKAVEMDGLATVTADTEDFIELSAN